METQIQRLAEKTWNKFKEIDASRRYLIALAGVPGSGKTTAAASIVKHLNALHYGDFAAKWPNSPPYRKGHSSSSHPDVALSLPLDGYHLTRAELSALPNPEEAHYRRGAAFTFNPQAYLKLIKQLRKPLEATTRTIRAPSFDHARKDPVQDDIHIPPTARIVIVEGLYVGMDRPGWREAAELMDEVWFIEVSLDIAAERVAKRNFKAGLSATYEEALDRTEKNDMRNAREVLAEKVPHIDETIDSVVDEIWRIEETGDNVTGQPQQDPESEQHTTDGRDKVFGAASVGFNQTNGSISSSNRRRNDSQAVDWDPNANDATDYKPTDENGSDRPTGRTERMDSIAELAAAGGGC